RRPRGRLRAGRGRRPKPMWAPRRDRVEGAHPPGRHGPPPASSRRRRIGVDFRASTHILEFGSRSMKTTLQASISIEAAAWNRVRRLAARKQRPLPDVIGDLLDEASAEPEPDLPEVDDHSAPP